MAAIRLILVGGFLGAGKTTLLHAAATRLVARGFRVGLITNDQAPNLVDTRLLRGQHFAVREVAGSCFCCNFDGLIAAAEGLRGDLQAKAPDKTVILAEPVGSCTDLSATILQPLKARFGSDFTCSPFTVLCDPARLRAIFGPTPAIHPSAAYIYRKQLEEADHVAIAKADTVTATDLPGLEKLVARVAPGARVHRLSARTGLGLDAWLDAMLADGPAGTRVVPVDYDTYAEGEAALGWLNAEYRLAGAAGCDWAEWARELMETLRRGFQERHAAIGHLKLLLDAGERFLAANLTGLDGAVEVRGELAGAGAAQLVLNVRVELPPADLEALVAQAMVPSGPVTVVDTVAFHCLSPGRPNPTHRYAEVVPPPR